MKKFIRLFAILLCTAMLLPLGANTGVSVSAADGNAYYVAPNGNDSADGSESAPFATLAGAQKALRARIAAGNLPQGGITVYIRGGTYAMTEPLVMSAEDSGTAECPITWCAYEDEEVILNGGVFAKASDFKPASAEAKAILRDQEAASDLLQLDLKALGITGTPELFINDTRCTVARFPNDELIFMYNGESTNTVEDSTGTVSEWHSIKGVKVGGYLEVDYFYSTGNVTGISEGKVQTDATFGTVTHFFYYNIMDEIDMPGEYYIDADTNTLYILPTEDFDSAQIMFTQLAPVQNGDVKPAMISGDGLQYTTFRGLTLQGCREGVFSFYNAQNVTVDNCVMRNNGGFGVELYGFNNSVINSHLYNLGKSGISVGGSEWENMIPGNNLVDNNHIHDFSQNSVTYQGGVNITDSFDYGVTVSHNVIHGSNHAGIVGGCSDAIVEYNIIYDVCREAADAGAIYTGRYEAQEQIYRYNLIYDIRNIYGWGSPNGIYVDDGGSFKICYGNILINVAGNAFAMGGGNNNQIYNNMMIECGTGIFYDSRQMPGGWEEDAALYADGLMWRCILSAKGYKTRNWMMRYPRVTLINISNDIDQTDSWSLGSFGLTTIRGNVFAACGLTQNFEGVCSSFIDVRDNVYYSTVSSVGFVDYEGMDLHLGDSTMVYNDIIGFSPIPVDEIGLR